MAEPNLSLLLPLLLPLLLLLSTPFTEAEHASDPTTFIKSACRNSTRYPALCFHSLFAYADRIGHSDRQLAAIALAVSIARTRSGALSLPRAGRRDLPALRDCAAVVSDGARQLGRSMAELGRVKRLGGRDFVWRMSNVETWVSAALTDTQTCVDGFAGRSVVEVVVRRRMESVARVISVALALVNRFAARHG